LLLNQEFSWASEEGEKRASGDDEIMGHMRGTEGEDETTPGQPALLDSWRHPSVCANSCAMRLPVSAIPVGSRQETARSCVVSGIERLATNAPVVHIRSRSAYPMTLFTSFSAVMRKATSYE
jgi:hypothetical protein